MLGVIAGYSFQKTPPKKQIKYHYYGNRNMSIYLRFDNNEYIEHQSVKAIKGGVINNPQTAIRIGELIGNAIYGTGDMKHPIHATLINNEVWNITGSTLSESSLGGTPSLLIEKSNGMLIIVNHSK